MIQNDEKHILYGGPLPPPIDDTSRSLGEIVLKSLAEKETENNLMFVSIHFVHAFN